MASMSDPLCQDNWYETMHVAYVSSSLLSE